MVNEEKSEKKFAWQEIIASSAIMTLRSMSFPHLYVNQPWLQNSS